MPLENTPQISEGNEELFDAISHGIENEGALPDEPPADVEGDESGEGEAEGDAGAGEGEGEAEGDQTPSDDATDEEADAAGYARDPATGKFVKKPEEAAVDPKTGKPVEAKKPDPINDPIPKEVKAETQTRIRSLIDMAKESTARAEKITTEFNTLVNGIQATGTTPEQFGEVISFMALFNSGDPAQQTKALELAENMCDQLATLLGKDRSIRDPIEQHTDLVAAVKAGQVTHQWAKEIARQRNQVGLRTNLESGVRTQQQQQQEYQRVESQSRQALTNLEQQLRAQDPQYEAKKAQLVPILQPIFRTMHPSQWPAAFQQAYQNLKLPAAAASGQSAKPKQQPMRAGKGTATGGAAAKGGSALDAVNAALAGMGQ